MKRWAAFKIKGGTAEQHNQLIYAETREDAVQEAWTIFECATTLEKRRVFVREIPWRGLLRPQDRRPAPRLRAAADRPRFR